MPEFQILETFKSNTWAVKQDEQCTKIIFHKASYRDLKENSTNKVIKAVLNLIKKSDYWKNIQRRYDMEGLCT